MDTGWVEVEDEKEWLLELAARIRVCRRGGLITVRKKFLHICHTCKNEEYIRKQNRDARAHSFMREGVIGQVKSPHGNPIKSVHVRITGKVQGCYFRKWSREQAKQMTINGWIRNCKDGSVEAVFSGRPAAVDSMLEQCKIGPGRARVVNMEVEVCEQPRGVGFKQLADYNGEAAVSSSEESGRTSGAMGEPSKTMSL